MPWISVHQEVDGTKLRRLYRAIGCSKFEALGILNFLWFWGMKNADETGLVKDADLEVLSRYLYGCGEDCQLDMGKVVQALVDTGWIDVVADGFYIHDWDTWQEQWYKAMTAREKDKERKRRERAAKKLAPEKPQAGCGTKAESPSDRARGRKACNEDPGAGTDGTSCGTRSQAASKAETG